MQRLRDRPIRQKITFIVLCVSGAVLLPACAALFAFQAHTIKQQFTHEIAAIGEMTARNATAALMSRDQVAAALCLSGLKAIPQISGARLELKEGQELAHFGTGQDGAEIRAARLRKGYRITGTRTLFAQAIMHEGEREGTLYLLADYRALSGQLLRLYGGLLALVLAVSLLLAFFLSNRFQRFITDPILRLAGTARTIADDKDYAVRAEKTCGDEVGVLTDAFNQMLTQIQLQDGALQGIQRELRKQVEAQARLAAILEATPDIVVSADPGGAVFFLNRAGRHLFGLPDDKDLTEMKLLDLHPTRAAEIIKNVGLPEAMRHGSWSGENAVLNSAGEEIHVSQVLIAHKDAAGQLQYCSTVMRDMTERRQADDALYESQHRLVETSRLAGMAEVATGVLHNVGNVLNSVTVSAGLVVEKLRRSKAAKLGKAAALLTSRNGDLVEYLTKDENGKKLPVYLAQLGEFFVKENAELLREVDQLGRNIEHIKEVVAMQQSYAKVSGLLEDLPAELLVEDAIAMNVGAFERHGVVVQKRFSPAPPLRVDRHKVLQILINLIRNAKYALDEVQRIDKRITISISAPDETSVRIEVADNGIGISAENLTRIFAHGFTTRKDGHGFGLHSGFLAARSMGGSLSVASLGVERGATFTLTLPIAPVTSPK